MRKLLVILLLLMSVAASSQFDDTTKYIKYPGIYGNQIPRLWAPKVLRPPTDTIYTKTGVAHIGHTLYVGNGVYWAAVGGGSGTVTQVSVGNLSPLFTTNTTNPTTTPSTSFTLSTQSANTVFAGPSTGSASAPTFRALVAADMPFSFNNGITLSGGVARWGGTNALTANTDLNSGGFRVRFRDLNYMELGFSSSNSYFLFDREFTNFYQYNPTSGATAYQDIVSSNAGETFLQLGAYNKADAYIGQYTYGRGYFKADVKVDMASNHRQFFYSDSSGFLFTPYLGAFRIDSLPTSYDTTTYKPTAWDEATGKLVKFNHWAGGGGQNISNADLTANGDYDHNWAGKQLKIDSIAEFLLASNLSSAPTTNERYTHLGGKTLSTGYDVYTQFDDNDYAYNATNNSNGGSTVLLEANAGSKNTIIKVHPDSIYLKNTEGNISIETLDVSSDTASFKPTAWNETTKRFVKFNHWPTGTGSSVSFGADNQIPYTNSGGTDFDYSANFTFDGTALVVTGTASVSTSTTTPLLIGGTGTTSDLLLRTTSGVGASGADMIFQVGNNGATEAMRILNSGNVGIGETAPGVKLQIAQPSGGNALKITGLSGNSRFEFDASTAAAFWSISNSASQASSIYLSPGGGFADDAPFWILERAAGNPSPFRIRAQKTGGVFENRFQIDPAGALTINTDLLDRDAIMKGDTDADLFWLDAGEDRLKFGSTVMNDARFSLDKGTSTAAANDLTLPSDGNLVTITGNTQVNAITTTNWQAGSIVQMIFTGAPLLKNNTAGGGKHGNNASCW